MSDAAPFFTRYGFSRTSDPKAPLVVEPYPHVEVEGALRATVVASAIDLVGGFETRAIAGTDATFTSDLSLRIPRPGRPSRLVARSERLRAGRRLVTTGVSLEDSANDGVYAYGETTFARIPRAPGDAPDVETLSTPLEIPHHPLRRPLDAEVGVEVGDARRGVLRIPLRPALLNPEGVMQGALVALGVECAALAIAGSWLDRPQVVRALDVRYLTAASVGPVVSRASWIGAPSARLLRVALHDAGRDERLAATAFVDVVDAPR